MIPFPYLGAGAGPRTVTAILLMVRDGDIPQALTDLFELSVTWSGFDSRNPQFQVVTEGATIPNVPQYLIFYSPTWKPEELELLRMQIRGINAAAQIVAIAVA